MTETSVKRYKPHLIDANDGVYVCMTAMTKEDAATIPDPIVNVTLIGQRYGDKYNWFEDGMHVAPETLIGNGASQADLDALIQTYNEWVQARDAATL